MDNAIKIAQIIITISQGVILYGNENDALFLGVWKLTLSTNQGKKVVAAEWISKLHW